MMIALGFYANRKQKGVEDYFLAGRRQNTFSIACLWMASWVGGAAVIGTSARAYDIGISASWYVLAQAIGLLLFGIFFAARVKKLGDEHRYLTYPDFIAHKFDSRTQVVATITTSLAFIAFAAGQLVAAVLFPDVANSNEILTTFVVELFPPGLKGLVLVGILAAVMSTADICILTVSANVTQDVYLRYINPHMSHQRMLRLGMLASVGVGVLAMLMAWKMQDIIGILLLGFTINGAALFLPTMVAMYAKRIDTSAAFWSILLSLITVIGWELAAQAGAGGVFQLESLWPGLAVSVLAYFLVYWRRTGVR